MGRTEQWFEQRSARVRARIEEARRKHNLSTSTIHEAFADISDDPPSESDARLIASVLGEQLKTGKFLHLLSDARHQLENLARDSTASAEEPIKGVRRNRLS